MKLEVKNQGILVTPEVEQYRKGKKYFTKKKEDQRKIMGGILELIKLIYGSKALSKVLGTRTNVIRLPDNELKQYTKQRIKHRSCIR
jgi:hypothetical protein